LSEDDDEEEEEEEAAAAVLEWREAAAEPAGVTKEVLVEPKVAPELVVAADKVRALRTTPRPITDENTVLLAISGIFCAVANKQRRCGSLGWVMLKRQIQSADAERPRDVTKR